MVSKITVALNNFQWVLMNQELQRIIPLAPIKNLEVESLVMAELYKSKISQFLFFTPKSDGQMRLKLSAAEAFSINKILGRYSEQYNIFIRIHIESKLPPCKSESSILQQ